MCVRVFKCSFTSYIFTLLFIIQFFFYFLLLFVFVWRLNAKEFLLLFGFFFIGLSCTKKKSWNAFFGHELYKRRTGTSWGDLQSDSAEVFWCLTMWWWAGLKCFVSSRAMRLYIGREYLFEAGRKSWLVQILFKVKQDWIVILEFQKKEVNFGNEDFCSNSGGLKTKIILSIYLFSSSLT